MKFLLPLVFVFFAVSVFAEDIFAAGDHRCFDYPSKLLGKPVNYCVQRSRPDLPAKPGEPVVYFMHGIMGGSKSWKSNGYSEALQVLASQPKSNFPAFTVVSFDTEATSFFSDPVRVHPGQKSYETWLIEEFAPHIEQSRGVCAARQCRALMGISMGGFGALKTALRHPEKFHSVAVSSPALSPFNVHDPDDEWKKYFDRHPIGSFRGMLLLRRIRKIFTTREYAEANDPIRIVESAADSATLPSIYMDVGGRDNYGFQEGFWLFQKALVARGRTVVSEFVPDGKHDMDKERRWHMLGFMAGEIRGQGDR